jgi:hypothetical protein
VLNYSGTGLGSFMAGASYNLTVAIGSRADVAGSDVQAIGLLAGGNAIGVVASGHPAAGTFNDITVTYTATNADAGKAIGITLAALSLGGQPQQASFDNVRLSFDTGVSSTPEPGSASLLGIGAALAAFGRFGMRLARRSRA